MFSTPQRRLGWMLTLIAVVGSGYVSLVREQRYADGQAAVHQTLEVQQAIGDALSLLKDAETGQRGYLLTGDAALLVTHARAEEALPRQLSRLGALVRDDAAQRQNLLELGERSRAKLDELAETIALYRAGQVDQALAVVREGRGQRLSDETRAIAARMLRIQAAHLTAREQAARTLRAELAWALGAVWLFFLGLVGAGIYTASRGMKEASRAAERLKESEKALRALADNASDLVQVISLDGARCRYVSPSCAALLGFSAAELLAAPALELLPPEERERMSRARSEAESNARGASFTHRLRTKSGEYRWFETIVRVVRSEPPSLQLTSRDITGRRLAEGALRRQTNRLESILSSIGDGVVVMNEERQLLVVNPVAAEYFPQGVGQHVPRRWAAQQNALMPDGKTPFPSEQGPLTRALGGEACDGVELILHDRSGRPRLLSVTSRPLYDADARIGCVAIYRDVTGQREIERRIQESEQRLRVLAEASFEGVAITKDGSVIDTNSVFAAWLGWEPEQLIGEPGLKFFAPEDHVHVRHKSAEAGSYYEAQMVRKDGSRFPVEVRGSFATVRGETVRIAVVRDITERRAVEAELKKQAELLHGMSLRDELTGLYNRRGFLEHAQHQMRAAMRTQRPATLFFVDLDGMKNINDSFGHEMGDRALVTAASVLSQVFRDSDVVARLGGDEFAVLAADCEFRDFAAVVGRLRAGVERSNQAASGPFQLAMSVGAAAFDPAAPRSLTQLIEAADQSMYLDKRARREGARGGDKSSGLRRAESLRKLSASSAGG